MNIREALNAVKSGKPLEEAVCYLREDDEEELGTAPSSEDVMDFLEENPTPTDDEFHDWCEENGFNKYAGEQTAYALAGRFVKFMRGGKSGGVNPGMPEDCLARAVEIEIEHTDDVEIATKIGFDHYVEHEKYYDPTVGLSTWEKTLEKSDA